LSAKTKTPRAWSRDAPAAPVRKIDIEIDRDRVYHHRRRRNQRIFHQRLVRKMGTCYHAAGRYRVPVSVFATSTERV